MDVMEQWRNIWIILGSLLGLSVFMAFVQTWKWFARTDRMMIDIMTLGRFLLELIGIVGAILLFIPVGISIWWLVAYKMDYEIHFNQRRNSVEDLIKIFLIVSFALKTLDILCLIIRQTSIDIFFMDWENPRTGDVNDISIWRTYFVANEFQEIQTFRRINLTLQLFIVLFLLKVINLENIACAQSEIHLFITDVNCTESNPVFRTAVNSFVFLGTAWFQYLLYMLVYQRFLSNRILNFIDLCSVSNISVFILDEISHGYYIHGRCPHGRSDVNMRDIRMNFYRENHRMTSMRGLEMHSNDQLFILKMTRDFQLIYRKGQQRLSSSSRNQTREIIEQQANQMLESYQNINQFLCAFINRSLVDYPYLIRQRYFLERIFNYEFQTRYPSDLPGDSYNLLFVDTDQTITKILFYGEERSLVIWNIITYLCLDYLLKNAILVCLITFVINQIAVIFRRGFSRRNLSRKAFISKEFLI